MNLAPFFNAQFFDDKLVPLAPAAGAMLHTYIAGTITPQVTYQDQAGDATNTNPIILDASGRCNLWLDPVLVYDFALNRRDGSLIKTWSNINGAAISNLGVTSVNGATGVVVLDATDIAFATATSTTWFSGVDVAAALDAVIARADAIPAASVPIIDSGSLIVATNVEDALQELAARPKSGALLRISQFTGSGTWTKGANTSFVITEGCGGGGGSTTLTAGGGGGGGGGYFRRIVTTPGSTETVTIGAGGAAGAPGGATSFGTWATANGGAAATGVTAGGAGGTSTGGTVNIAGAGGCAGGNASSNAMFGAGGSSFYGGGALGQWNGASGTAGAANSGGGGSGGTSGGAAGGSGLVIIYEYS